MKHYVTCITLNESMTETVLIIKNDKMPFLAGKLMHPGGSIEKAETLNRAASREFLEECGVDIGEDKWKFVGTLILNEDGTEIAHCHYMKAVIPDELLASARQMESEPVLISKISALTLDHIDADVMSMFVLAYSKGCTVGTATVTRYL